MAELQRPVLLYDADCRVCRFAARVVARLDRSDLLAFLPLDAAEAAPLLEPLAEAERFTSWRLAEPDGSLSGRGAGATGLLRAAGHTHAARALDAVPDSLLEGVYDLVARNRGLLGKIVPDGPGPRSYP